MATLTNLEVISSPDPANPGSSGWGQVTITGTGTGDIAINKNGTFLGALHATTASWTITDWFMLGVGGPYTITAVASNTLTKTVTIGGTSPPPTTGATLSTLDVVSSPTMGSSGYGTVTITGTGTGDIAINKNGTLFGYLHATITSWSITDDFIFGVGGPYTITAVASNTLTKTVTIGGGTPPPTNTYGCVNGSCLPNSGQLPPGCNSSCTTPPPTGTCSGINIPMIGCQSTTNVMMAGAGLLLIFLMKRK
jgi:hypothetical protein